MGSFYAEQPAAEEGTPRPFELKSEDFDYVEYDPALETPEMLVVAISTELPVHESMLAEPYDSSNFSAFLQLIRLSGDAGAATDVVGQVNLLREMRFELLPPVRRAAAFYGRGEMEKLSRELEKFPEFGDLPIASSSPWKAMTAILQGFLKVLGAGDMREAAQGELAELLEAAFEADRDGTRALLLDLNSRSLQEHRRAVVDTLVRSLEMSDALVPGLWVEALPDLEVDKYRIQRADYDDVKTRFQETFELGSRTLVLPASLANIARRGDARKYSDGERRPLNKALRANAEIREGWLEELPSVKGLYDDRARRTRNLIGHRLVSYDFKDSVLIDNNGNRYNYLSFLRDYLGAVRSCTYQLDVVQLLTEVDQRETDS